MIIIILISCSRHIAAQTRHGVMNMSKVIGQIQSETTIQPTSQIGGRYDDSPSHDGAAGHEMPYLDTYEFGDDGTDGFPTEHKGSRYWMDRLQVDEADPEFFSPMDNAMELDFDD
ncbi:hypothetical protein BI344_10330 [Chromobacterium sphagni]|uniref:Uncharacterized protein n=2 Tax=Chromobacterium sphagni TaxID=1903179 RepID=A0ABX3CAG9_9NEIS|nr:hypothetical protein BI344_10330 [Chromobacterium sphagni]